MTRLWLLLAATVLASAGGAIAQIAPPSEPPGREAIFKTPKGAYGGLVPLGPYWPERAGRMGVGGLVAMDCVVDDANRVTNCKIVQETPADYDFGFAILKMVSRGLVTAAPPPEGSTAPADHVWRFRIVLPARSL